MVLMIVLCSFVTKTRSKRQEYEKKCRGKHETWSNVSPNRAEHSQGFMRLYDKESLKFPTHFSLIFRKKKLAFK